MANGTLQWYSCMMSITAGSKKTHRLSEDAGILARNNASNIHLVSDCQEQFNFVLPSVQLARRAEKFVNKLQVD